jgi:hypothetical protein
MKLFSEGKSPLDVVVGLDHAADRVRAIYRKYWELKLVLTEVVEARHDLHSLLRLHKILKDLTLRIQRHIISYRYKLIRNYKI